VTSLLWILAVSGWLLAAAAWVVARGASRRARQLHDMYWQLRYDHGELKARVDAGAPDTTAAAAAAPPRPAPGTQFVPLSQVKR
jgi:hypothetical protein